MVKRWQPKPVANDPAKVAWLKQNVVAFSSIDPNDDDFSDLRPLKKLIGDARVVQLGEQSHGDGTCFETKIRLIKFLHQEMGFDILAFESGLYDCEVAWRQFKDGQAGLEAAKQGVFGIWTGSGQTSELWSYLATQANSDLPLRLTGFDCQFTAPGSSNNLLDELKSLPEKFGVANLEEEDWVTLTDGLEAIFASQQPEVSKDAFLETLTELQSSVAELDMTKSSVDSRFWLQNLESIKDHCSRAWNEKKQPSSSRLANVEDRDKQMADNLNWMLNTQYPKRKVIVWAASFHIARQLDKVRVPDGSANYRKLKQMGQHVFEAQGNKVFTVGFTTQAGKAGVWFRKQFSLAEAPEGTLESLINATGVENGWLNFRGTKESAPWLHEQLYARPLGYTWMTSKWPEQFDAMVFNREMRPSTR